MIHSIAGCCFTLVHRFIPQNYYPIITQTCFLVQGDLLPCCSQLFYVALYSVIILCPYSMYPLLVKFCLISTKLFESSYEILFMLLQYGAFSEYTLVKCRSFPSLIKCSVQYRSVSWKEVKKFMNGDTSGSGGGDCNAAIYEQ